MSKMYDWAKTLNAYTRPCLVCGKHMYPFTPETLTAHEYECFKLKPELVPAEWKDKFIATQQWEIRHMKALLAARKREAIRRAKHVQKIT